MGIYQEVGSFRPQGEIPRAPVCHSKLPGGIPRKKPLLLGDVSSLCFSRHDSRVVHPRFKRGRDRFFYSEYPILNVVYWTLEIQNSVFYIPTFSLQLANDQLTND